MTVIVVLWLVSAIGGFILVRSKWKRSIFYNVIGLILLPFGAMPEIVYVLGYAGCLSSDSLLNSVLGPVKELMFRMYPLLFESPSGWPLVFWPAIVLTYISALKALKVSIKNILAWITMLLCLLPGFFYLVGPVQSGSVIQMIGMLVIPATLLFSILPLVKGHHQRGKESKRSKGSNLYL